MKLRELGEGCEMKKAELITFVLDIGEQMLISGAEVNRVEDSITRMCNAYGAKYVNVLAITTSIILTVRMKDDEIYTQTRRITGYATDLNQLDYLNNLSRFIVSEKPGIEQIDRELSAIQEMEVYSPVKQYGIYALIASSFTIFFGGSLLDGIASAVIAVILREMITFVQKVDKNTAFTMFFTSFVVGIVAILAVRYGFGDDLNMIIVGNIMPMIPGLALTNGMKDIINGDTIAGLLRISEAFVVAISIAFGFGIATLLLGGII